MKKIGNKSSRQTLRIQNTRYKAYLKNKEINQINTTVKNSYQYKITAPPRTFQIDIFWRKRGDRLTSILLLVDILSRKAWACVLTKSKQEKRAEVNVAALKEFQKELGDVNGLEGYNEFSSRQIKSFVKRTTLAKILVQQRKST